MYRIKRFIDMYVPITACNLRCPYCYITQHRLFEASLPKFTRTAEEVRKAFSIERMGGSCFINICGGGETLLSSQVIGYVRALLEEGHFVSIVTNGTISKRFDEMVQFPSELLEKLFIKFSYHYLELKNRKMLDRFFENVIKMKEAGASFTVEETANDESIPYIEEMIQVCESRLGAKPHMSVGRDETVDGELPILTHLPKDEYVKKWSIFQSEFFDFKYSIFGVERKEFCYAGDWSFWVNVETGKAQQCYSSHMSKNIYDDVNKPFALNAVGNRCLECHCYNGHAFLTAGNIPSLNTPTYAFLRNRICSDGSQWLSPIMNEFMSSRLVESNKEYSFIKKMKTNFVNDFADMKRHLKYMIRRLLMK